MHTSVSGMTVCITLSLLMGSACAACMHMLCIALIKLRVQHCNVLTAASWDDALGGSAPLRLAMAALQIIVGRGQRHIYIFAIHALPGS